MNRLKYLNSVYSRKVFAIALILGLLGLTVFLSLKIYMLVQARNELTKQLRDQAQNELKEQAKRAKQACEDEELTVQIDDGEARHSLQSELWNIEDKLRKCAATRKPGGRRPKRKPVAAPMLRLDLGSLPSPPPGMQRSNWGPQRKTAQALI
jgi:hypothetical protein